MKKVRIWCRTIAKKWIKNKVFWILLLAFGILAFVLERLPAQRMQGVVVAVYMEETSDDYESQFQKSVCVKLQKDRENHLAQFVIVDSRQQVEQMVAKREAECGYILPPDMLTRLIKGDANRCVSVIASPSTSLEYIVSEQLFACLFEIASGEIFAEYVTNHPELAADDEQAMQAYRNRLGDGSTFHFAYEENEEKKVKGMTNNGAVPTMDKLAAVALFVFMLLGVYECMGDRVRCSYYFKGDYISQILAGSFQMLLPYLIGGLGMGLLRILSLRAVIVCIPLVLLYCWGAYGLFQKKNILLSAIPLLLLLGLVVCPVFVDLAEVFPVIRPVQLCFPITWLIQNN